MPPGVRKVGFLLFVAFCTLLIAQAAGAGTGGLLPPTPHSPNAHRITDAYEFIGVFVIVIFVLVEGALVAFVVRYRRGKRARTAEGPQIHGAKRLEIIWTVVPSLILTAIACFVFYELPGITGPPAVAANDQTTIGIEGRQFYWMFHYPNGAVSFGTMYAPANEVVHEKVYAPDNDVIHSWWAPNLAGQIYAIPGQSNHSWFEAPVGTYAARCALLCGIQHADMTAVVKVVPRAEYESFIAKRAANPTSITLGKEEFKYVCSTCHRLKTTYIGPALAGNPLLHDTKGITTILRKGVGNMPAVASDWSNDQIDALIAYTKTIKAPPNGQ
jgi:cytochrome c oxidase subunit 2